jgi:hypothetical protein
MPTQLSSLDGIALVSSDMILLYEEHELGIHKKTRNSVKTRNVDCLETSSEAPTLCVETSHNDHECALLQAPESSKPMVCA